MNIAPPAALRAELLAFLRRRLPPGEAEDVLQDVLVRAHDHREALRDDEKLAAWLTQIARNAVTDFYRRRAAKPVSAAVDPETLPTEPSEDVPGDELTACLRAMLEQLPAEYRDAVRQSDLEHRPQQAIADDLGVSLSGAKSRIQRGRAKLKALIQACCHLELDAYGNAVEQVCKNEACACCKT